MDDEIKLTEKDVRQIKTSLSVNFPMSIELAQLCDLALESFRLESENHDLLMKLGLIEDPERASDEAEAGENKVWNSMPDEVSKWVLMLDLHLTEHDLVHAGKALRSGWPAVRDYFFYVMSERIKAYKKLMECSANSKDSV